MEEIQLYTRVMLKRRVAVAGRSGMGRYRGIVGCFRTVDGFEPAHGIELDGQRRVIYAHRRSDFHVFPLSAKFYEGEEWAQRQWEDRTMGLQPC